MGRRALAKPATVADDAGMVIGRVPAMRWRSPDGCFLTDFSHPGPRRGTLTAVIAPVVLVILSMLLAAVVAFGTHPNWADTNAGLQLIYFTRHLQWPLVVICLGCCIGIVGLVVAGRQRAWWLLVLAPVLALFIYRFSTRSFNAFGILENPLFMQPAEATFLSDEDYVVGLRFEGIDYAYPYRLLYTRPVVIQPDHDKRMMLLWSPFANRARACYIGRDLRARDLEIVSMPANALLLYNRRLGQFINGLTLQTRKGESPAGIGTEIATQKMTWKRWRDLHPQTRVLAPLPGQRLDYPATPALPYYDLPPRPESLLEPQTQVAVIQTSPPIAVPMDRIANTPLNFTAGQVPVLVLLDRETGQVRAFDRRLEVDLIPRFKLNTDPRRKDVALVDTDTTIGWSADGRAIDGDPGRRGFQLTELPVETDLYWGVMKFWHPELLLHQTELLR